MTHGQLIAKAGRRKVDFLLQPSLTSNKRVARSNGRFFVVTKRAGTNPALFCVFVYMSRKFDCNVIRPSGVLHIEHAVQAERNFLRICTDRLEHEHDFFIRSRCDACRLVA